MLISTPYFIQLHVDKSRCCDCHPRKVLGGSAKYKGLVTCADRGSKHLKVEMGLDLSSIRYVVFDEADRLFEMGFAAQLTEILHALPQSRQTLLFSATLPKSLVEFARAGLQEPNLVRLDAESKISPDLQSAFFTMKSAEKEGALMHILNVGSRPSR